jgi:hypothetical protein
MRKSLLPRFLLYVLLAAAAFAALVQFQFGKSQAFAHRAGNLVVEGKYAGTGTPRALDGVVRVFFGGMEFLPSGARNITFLDDGVSFGLDGERVLSFTTQYTGGALELIMEAVFPEGHELPVEIPCRPLKTSSIREEGASFTVSSDRVNYVFTRAQTLRRLGTERVLRLDPEERLAGYRALPERKTINPDDFILAEAQDDESYEGALTMWRDKSYSAWNRAVSSSDAAGFFSGDGETANAFISEAVRRGTYRSAAQAVNAVYAPGAGGAWEVSAYLGKLEAALRFLSAAERDRYTRLARLFNEKSPDFLKEFRVVEFLGIRGYGSLLDDAAEQLRLFDPAMITLEQCAGFLEGLLDWTQARPDRDNPFVRFGDQAFYVAGDGLRKNPFSGAVLSFSGDEADLELNLRLGISLSRFEDKTRQALGRTLTLSVLSLTDESGSAPRVVVQRNGGDFAEKPDAGRLHAARIYYICGTDGPYARALPVVTAQDVRSGLWAWTAAQSLEINAAPASTDVTVQFSAGETHYLLLRGIRPFARIQLHGADIPSDPQFERYDTSGWAYSAQEQTLMVKLKHRLPSEHIVILQTAAPPPEAPAPAETDTEI